MNVYDVVSVSSLIRWLCGQLVQLGHCVFHLLGLLSVSPPSNQLRSHALQALCAVAGLNPDPILEAAAPTDLSAAPEDFLGVVSGRVGGGGCGRGRAFASFLPGVSMAVMKLLTSDAKTAMGVVTLGLLTWAHYVAMVMADDSVDVGVSEGEESGGMKVVEQTDDWLKKTCGNLSVLVDRVCVLVTSDAWRVRLYLVGWAHVLVTRCSA